MTGQLDLNLEREPVSQCTRLVAEGSMRVSWEKIDAPFPKLLASILSYYVLRSSFACEEIGMRLQRRAFCIERFLGQPISSCPVWQGGEVVNCLFCRGNTELSTRLWIGATVFMSDVSYKLFRTISLMYISNVIQLRIFLLFLKKIVYC